MSNDQMSVPMLHCRYCCDKVCNMFTRNKAGQPPPSFIQGTESKPIEPSDVEPLMEEFSKDNPPPPDEAGPAEETPKPQFSLLQCMYVGIIFNYLSIGFVPAFLMNPLCIYMVHELNASPQQQNTVMVLISLPWCFKVLYGFMSDARPLLDYRRKSYLMLGNLVAVIALAALTATARSGDLTIAMIGWLLFTQTCGMILSDVMSDAYCCELSKAYETTASTGGIQALAYGCRFFAAILGACGGTFLYNKTDWGWGLDFWMVCLICAVFQCIAFPMLVFLEEERASSKAPAESIPAQIQMIWQTVQLRAVWQPLLYIYFYNVMQVPNVAWNSFLLKGLEFSALELGALHIGGSILSFLGLIVYRNFLFDMSWRLIYLITTLLSLVFSCLQLLLIYRVNKEAGISDFLFSFGDNLFAAFVNGVQFLPTVIMMLALCPDQQEGATFAMFTTFSNIAGVIGGVIGNAAGQIWDVSNAAMLAQNFSGMAYLTILKSCLQVFPILFVCFLPDSRESHEAMAKSGEKSRFFGGLFIVLMVCSLSLAVGNAVYELH